MFLPDLMVVMARMIIRNGRNLTLGNIRSCVAFRRKATTVITL